MMGNTEDSRIPEYLKSHFKKDVAASIKRAGGRVSISALLSDLRDAKWSNLGSLVDLEGSCEEHGFELEQEKKGIFIRRTWVKEQA